MKERDFYQPSFLVQGRELARQEAWALLLAHNMIAGLAARAAATAGLAPGQICFTAVLSLARAPPPPTPAARTAASARPAETRPPPTWTPPSSPSRPAAQTASGPSGRTAAERQKWISEPADYTLTIVPSNLPKTDVSPGS